MGYGTVWGQLHLFPLQRSDLCYSVPGMTREDLALELSILLRFYSSESGFLDFKEGSPEEPGDYDVVIDLGWVAKTDEGGPWRRLSITPAGEAMIERMLGVTGVELTT